jgi:hypothetical protein
MDEKEISKITVYTLKLVEQTIGPEEFEELNSILSANPDAARHYNSLMMMISNFQDRGKEIVYDEITIEGALKNAFWKEMADYERTALAVEISKEEPEKEDKTLTEIRKIRPKVSKLSIYSLLLCSATLIFVIAYAHLISMRHGIEVATLSDSMNAKWADIASPVEKGTRLVTGEKRWLLREGYAELLFDNQARVVLEGPAEFQILAEDRVGLSYGKVYARVPQTAVGFSVYTPNAKIIDLGTEFGVQVEIGGNTQLHVLKGKTMLMAGKTDRVNMEISQGNARKISGKTGEISDICCRPNHFVRVINSESNCVWRGQNLDLADIVGGGNGFGSGTIGMSIDPTSGKPSSKPEGRRGASNDYRLVASIPYVDGVFVPNGRSQQIVSSQGHLFQECPETTGLTCENIINVTTNVDFLVTQTQYVSDASLRAISMHANMGITFDLQAMRGLIKGVDIQRFQSQFGIRRYAVRPSASNADFWVLVDGKLKFKKEHVKIGQFHSIDIELSENDRFLTLMITEGDDPETRFLEDMVLTAIDSDWGIFIDPVLVLSPK